MPVLFAAKPDVVIPPGKAGDERRVRFGFPAMSDVAVSIFVPAQTMTTVTMHGFANSTNYAAAGDQTAAADAGHCDGDVFMALSEACGCEG